MKNKILIAIAICLICLVISVRFIFHEKLKEFKLSVSLFEETNLNEFRKLKEIKLASLSTKDKLFYNLYNKQLDESEAIVKRDTTISYLYLSETLNYKFYSLGYLDCLEKKCLIGLQNEVIGDLIIAKERYLQKKFGETFSVWYKKLKDDKLIKKTKLVGCDSFFKDFVEISIDEKVWNSFESFMLAYDSDISSNKTKGIAIKRQLELQIANTKSRLRKGIISYYNNKISESLAGIITSVSELKTFNSPLLGQITYNVEKIVFNKDILQQITEETFREQWKNNSLSTGSMPYSYQYGSGNYCSNYNCSQIEVKSGNTDVLATVKDDDGDVIRHAYIQANSEFTFDIPNGQYQVFFYSGEGWNPNKIMKIKAGGVLHGGFVTNEIFQKDNYITLSNQTMSYELIMQQNGNLTTQSSSPAEAF